MKKLTVLCGLLMVWISGCDFNFDNLDDLFGPDGDTDEVDTLTSDTDTALDTAFEPRTEFHKALYMQEDPASPDDATFATDKLDILLVVDNSGSMSVEQDLLSTALFEMVASLTKPLPGWPYPALESVRVGVTTTDLGLTYGYDRTVSDAVEIPNCHGYGDGAELQDSGSIPIELADMSIACNGVDGSGCPDGLGWICVDDDANGIGLCEAPAGDTQVGCSEQGLPWTEVAGDEFDGVATAQMACAAQVGTDGCGIEQQLQVVGQFSENDAASMLREDAQLAVLLVTDEEDCSIEDPALFDTPEFSNPSLQKLNVACATYPQYLTPVNEIRQMLLDAKGGDWTRVVFGAIAGVPTVDTCEGGGHLIDGCLDHDDMAFVAEADPSSGMYLERPACERYVSDSPVTTARPGRRIVSLVQQFQEYGYAYSICNDDYTDVLNDFSLQMLRSMQQYQPILVD